MIGDFLYRLTPRDEQVTPIMLVAQRQANRSVAAANLVDVYSFPGFSNYLLKLTSFEAQGIGGGAQTISRIIWRAQRGAQVDTVLRLLDVVPVANTVRDVFYLPQPRYFDLRVVTAIECEIQYSSAALANAITTGVYGEMIPVGNVSGASATITAAP